jgi:hypothetical protein
MKLKSIRLTSLRVVELLSFLKQIVPVLLLHPTLNAKLKRMADSLSKTQATLSVAQNQGSFEGETKAVKQAAKKLTESVKLFVKFVDAFTHSDNATVKEQANLIITAVKKEMPTLTRSGQKAQIGSIVGLNDLFTNNSRYAEALVALNAKSFWEKVMVDDEDYNGTYSNRTDVKASEADAESASTIAKAACTECRAVLDLLDDLYNVEEKPEYLEMITKINLEIDAVMATLHTRETLAKKAKTAKAQKE